MCGPDDFGIPEVLRAADGCECPGRWCERPQGFMVRAEDIVTWQAEARNG